MPLTITPFHDPVTGTFTYVVDDGQGAAAVIDPVMGFDARNGRRDPAPAQAVLDHVTARGLSVQWLLETHAHADHLSGGPWLQQRCGGRMAIGEHIVGVQERFAAIYGLDDLQPRGADFDHLFTDGETFAIGTLNARVMHVPGHTPADIAFLVEDPEGRSDAAFVGDTLFMPEAGTARCDFPGGDAHALFHSVRRLLALPGATRVFVCHDYPAEGVAARHVATVDEHRARNVHVHDGVVEDEYVAWRRARDATLALPQLMLPSVQVNLRAGHLPRPDAHGVVSLKLPVDVF